MKMDDDYKLGYENGRYAALEALKRKLSNQKEPLFQKILSDGKADQTTSVQLSLLDKLSSWVIDEMEEAKND